MPKSMRHKRILDIAERKPEAPLEAIADEIPSATVDLVEEVLDEYGDPGGGDGSAEDATEDGTGQAPVADQNADEAQPPVPTAQADRSTTGGSAEAGVDQQAGSAETDTDEAGSSEAAGGTETVDNHSTGTSPAESDTEKTAGDAETAEPEKPGSSEQRANTDSTTDDESLSADDRALLRAVHDHPEATQRELSDHLGVSAATVNRRVDAVEGLQWRNRRSFVEQYFDSDTDVHTTTNPSTMTNGAEPSNEDDEGAQSQDEADEEAALEALEKRIDKLEEQLEAVAEADRANPSATAEQGSEADVPALYDDPDLAHRVVHACMQYEEISDDEERRILREMMG